MRSLQTMAPSYVIRGRDGLLLRPPAVWLLTVMEMGIRFMELTASTGLNGEFPIPLPMTLYLQENVLGLSLTDFLTFPVQGLSNSPHGPKSMLRLGLYGLPMWHLHRTLL